RSCGKASDEDTRTRRRLFRLFAYACVLLTWAAEPASSSGAIATIKSITRTVLTDTVRVTIELDSEVPQFHEERLADPPRVFVDLPSTRAAAQLADRTLRFARDHDVAHLVRI